VYRSPTGVGPSFRLCFWVDVLVRLDPPLRSFCALDEILCLEILARGVNVEFSGGVPSRDLSLELTHHCGTRFCLLHVAPRSLHVPPNFGPASVQPRTFVSLNRLRTGR